MLCEEFNKLIITLKKDEQQSANQYPWLEKDDDRRNLTDRDIREKYRFGDFMSNPERTGRIDGYTLWV